MTTFSWKNIDREDPFLLPDVSSQAQAGLDWDFDLNATSTNSAEIPSMPSLSRTVLPIFIFALGLLSIEARADDPCNTEEHWICRGYCFMGGDTPTNPWIPVSSEGSSEQEARDNIDCGRFEEVSITCSKV